MTNESIRFHVNGPIRWFHELIFSIYFPFLVISAHEREVGGRWAIGIVRWGISHGYLHDYGLMLEDYRVDVADVLLIWFSILMFYLIVRLTSKLSISRILLRYVAGALAVAGYPLTLIYTLRHSMPFLYVELAIAAACFVLWSKHRWPVSTPLNITLVILHYAFWASLGGGRSFGAGLLLLWPSWYRSWKMTIFPISYTWGIYPLMGLCSTLLWACFFRMSNVRRADAG